MRGIGYFAGQYHRPGRQAGRVLATQYEEVVVDRLFAGNVQLIKALQLLVEAAETTLHLDEAKSRRTIIRVDAGDPVAVLQAYMTFYAQRGGGIETSFKGDKQGLDLTTRNKKRFEAQCMPVLLGSLAHSFIRPLQTLLAPLQIVVNLGET